MMTKEGYANIVNFMTFRIGVVVLGCDHIGIDIDIDIVKMLNLTKILYFNPRHWTN